MKLTLNTLPRHLAQTSVAVAAAFCAGPLHAQTWSVDDHGSDRRHLLLDANINFVTTTSTLHTYVWATVPGIADFCLSPSGGWELAQLDSGASPIGTHGTVMAATARCPRPYSAMNGSKMKSLPIFSGANLSDPIFDNSLVYVGVGDDQGRPDLQTARHAYTVGMGTNQAIDVRRDLPLTCLDVSALQGWQRMPVPPGKQIRSIRDASGLWNVWVGTTGAVDYRGVLGIDAVKLAPYVPEFPVPSAPGGALLYRVGTDGAAEPVVNLPTALGTPAQDLYLRINDPDHYLIGTNEGSLRVCALLEDPPPTTVPPPAPPPEQTASPVQFSQTKAIPGNLFISEETTVTGTGGPWALSGIQWQNLWALDRCAIVVNGQKSPCSAPEGSLTVRPGDKIAIELPAARSLATTTEVKATFGPLSVTAQTRTVDQSVFTVKVLDWSQYRTNQEALLETVINYYITQAALSLLSIEPTGLASLAAYQALSTTLGEMFKNYLVEPAIRIDTSTYGRSVSGEESRYRYNFPAGYQFCRVHTKVNSIAPTSGSRASHLGIGATSTYVAGYTWVPKPGLFEAGSWIEGHSLVVGVQADLFEALKAAGFCRTPLSTFYSRDGQTLHFDYGYPQ